MHTDYYYGKHVNQEFASQLHNFQQIYTIS